MASQLGNMLCCIKHYCGLYEQNIVHSVLADDWTTELAIIASNGFDFIQDRAFLFHISGIKLTFPSCSIRENTI